MKDYREGDRAEKDTSWIEGEKERGRGERRGGERGGGRGEGGYYGYA